MTAADQIVRSAKIVLAMEGRPHMGRPPKLTPHQKKEAIKRRDAGELTREIARTFNVSHSTISRLSP
jgi:DNA invertase Pin-like site-specific DNA recombinase